MPMLGDPVVALRISKRVVAVTVEGHLDCVEKLKVAECLLPSRFKVLVFLVVRL